MVHQLISKVLVKRLKHVLLFIIYGSPSAFVQDRPIIDNILIVYEIIHFLRWEREGKPRYVSLKLDMSKACDRIEWDYLKEAMHKMCFKAKWV